MQLAAATGDADRLRREWVECQRRVDELDPGSLPSEADRAALRRPPAAGPRQRRGRPGLTRPGRSARDGPGAGTRPGRPAHPLGRLGRRWPHPAAHPPPLPSRPTARRRARAPARPGPAGLTPLQREAVDATDQVLCVLAGAGAGKTRVLTLRVARRVRDGSAARGRVLVCTFSRKAADELPGACGPWGWAQRWRPAPSTAPRSGWCASTAPTTAGPRRRCSATAGPRWRRSGGGGHRRGAARRGAAARRQAPGRAGRGRSGPERRPARGGGRPGPRRASCPPGSTRRPPGARGPAPAHGRGPGRRALRALRGRQAAPGRHGPGRPALGRRRPAGGGPAVRRRGPVAVPAPLRGRDAGRQPGPVPPARRPPGTGARPVRGRGPAPVRLRLERRRPLAPGPSPGGDARDQGDPPGREPPLLPAGGGGRRRGPRPGGR